MPRAARLPIVSALHEDLKWPVLLLTDRADHALALHDELGFWTSSPRFLFAEPNPLFYEASPWGPTTGRQPIDVLTALGEWESSGAGSVEAAPLISDLKIVYPIRENIPVMLIEEGIPLEQLT